MIKAIITDFSRVLLFPTDETYLGSLNGLHKQLSQEPNYNILDNFKINTELLDFYGSLKGRVNLYIFTSETIQDDPAFQQSIKPVFDSIFSAAKLGINKKEFSAYEALLKEINLKPYEVLYVDDAEVNILAAKEAGLNVLTFKTTNEAVHEIENQLNAAY